MDISEKLSAPSPHFELDATKETRAKKQKLYSKKQWEKSIENILTNTSVIEANSIFVRTGVGLSLKTRVKKQMSAHKIKTYCKKNLDKLSQISQNKISATLGTYGKVVEVCQRGLVSHPVCPFLGVRVQKFPSPAAR